MLSIVNRICCAVVLLLAAFGQHASAMSAADLIYITEEHPPYNYTENGEVTGLATEVLRLMWQRLGVPPQPISVEPWARGMQALDDGPAVMLFAAGWSEERAERFHFLRPLTVNESGLLARVEDGIVMESLKDLWRYRVGVVRKDRNARFLIDVGVLDSELEKVSSLKTNVRKLAHGRVDLIAGEVRAMYRTIRELRLDPDDFEVVHVLDRAESGFMLSRDVPEELVQSMQRALDEVRATPHFETLVERFFH